MTGPLILASGSPRRRQLLKALGLPFVTVIACVDEGRQPGESPVILVQRLSRAKARVAGADHRSAVVISADTIVVLDDHVLGKPEGRADAVRMLRALRGRAHLVYSSVTALDAATGREVTALSCSRVWMRDYADHEIAAYVDSGDALDKAGAYAIQNREFSPVARFDGCYAAIMGLPLCHLSRALAEVGVRIHSDVAQACQAALGAHCCLWPEQAGDALCCADLPAV